jgi:hypothetical protein
VPSETCLSSSSIPVDAELGAMSNTTSIRVKDVVQI